MPIETVLNKVSKILEGVDYAFIGSANLYIQGLDVSPRDIDIFTTVDGIHEIDRLLSEYRTKDIYFDETEGRNSFRSFYSMDGVEIEVLGNRNNLYRTIDSLKHKKLIATKGVYLPCVSLEDELETYTKMGRTDTVLLIENFFVNNA